MNERTKKKIFRLIIATQGIILFIFIWSLCSFWLDSAYLPGPLDVFSTLAYIIVQNEMDFSGFTISQHIFASLTRVLIGFILAASVAIPIGLLSGWSWFIEKTTSPVFELIRPIPPLAWIPFAIYFFRDPFSSIFIVFIGAFFPILTSTITGVKSTNPQLKEVAMTMGAKRLSLFLKVIIPSSIPNIMTGLRIGLGVGWMCVIAAELVGVRNGGLGVYLLLMSEVGLFEKLFSGMIIIGLLGFIMVSVLTQFERRFFVWQAKL